MNFNKLSRRQWCGMVGLLCSPTMADDSTDALIRMLPAMHHIPDYLFTEETAKAVASAKRRLACPAWDEITAALNEFRRTYIHEPPKHLALPPPPKAPPTQSEIEAVAASVAEAKRVIAEEHAKVVELEQLAGRDKPPMRPRSACYSGQQLMELRIRRFVECMELREMTIDQVPEPYRSAILDRRAA